MTLRQLTIFVVAARRLNLGEAAEELEIAQPVAAKENRPTLANEN